METIENKLIEKLTDQFGERELLEFEGRFNPMAFKAQLLAMKIPLNYASHLASLYEEHVYKPGLVEYHKLNSDESVDVDVSWSFNLQLFRYG
jgi:hypothetical protein